jgi:4-alpha-glucanotransferase
MEDLMREVLPRPGPTRREFNAFLREHPEVARYGRFRDSKERRWDTSDDASEPADRDGGRHRLDQASWTYHAFSQWLFTGQMRETSSAARDLGVHLFLDLPLGVHPEGFDVARYPDSFVRGMTVGAPPDVVFRAGQEWGFPPLHPERTRARNHDYFRAVLRHHMQFASVLRIDHVMGLHRLFWIPEGSSADRGTYVRYPAEELYAMLCLESHRHRSILVGENLGTVPIYVNTSLRRHGISPLYVLHYDLESGGGTPGGGIRPGAVASLNSHDLPPFGAFWTAADVDEREAQGLLTHEQAQTMRGDRTRIRESLTDRLRTEAGLRGPLDEATVLRALLAGLGRSPAWATIVNLEDLWSETSSQNVPGTSTEVPNWRRKSRRAFEDFASDAAVKDLLGSVNAARNASRSPRKSKTPRPKEEGS